MHPSHVHDIVLSCLEEEKIGFHKVENIILF